MPVFVPDTAAVERFMRERWGAVPAGPWAQLSTKRRPFACVFVAGGPQIALALLDVDRETADAVPLLTVLTTAGVFQLDAAGQVIPEPVELTPATAHLAGHVEPAELAELHPRRAGEWPPAPPRCPSCGAQPGEDHHRLCATLAGGR